MPKAKIVTRVVVLAATKGGVGKTTLATALAVRASRDSKRVAMFDNDGQRSLHQWWHDRCKNGGDPNNPAFLDVETSAEAQQHVIDEGKYEWVFVDTPPGSADPIEQSVYIADFVLIPTRTSSIDIYAQNYIQRVCHERGKPFAFVLNAVEATAVNMTAGAIRALQKGVDDRPADVLDTHVSHRRAYMGAMTKGKTGPEIKGGEVCALEIDALWAEVKSRTTQAVRSR